MSSQIDQEKSKKVFLRMRNDDSSASAILGVLQEINPDASSDEIILFMADCIQKPPIVKTRRTPRSSELDFDSRNFQSSNTCSSSSSKSNC